MEQPELELVLICDASTVGRNLECYAMHQPPCRLFIPIFLFESSERGIERETYFSVNRFTPQMARNARVGPPRDLES